MMFSVVPASKACFESLEQAIAKHGLSLSVHGIWGLIRSAIREGRLGIAIPFLTANQIQGLQNLGPYIPGDSDDAKQESTEKILLSYLKAYGYKAWVEDVSDLDVPEEHNVLYIEWDPDCIPDEYLISYLQQHNNAE